MDLPPPVRAALPDDEEVLGAELSAAEQPHERVPGVRVSLAVWVVLTTSRCWVVAADGEGAPWVRATGDIAAVRVQTRRLGRDRVRVGVRSLPLRRGGADRLGPLLVAWARAGAGGAEVHPPRGPRDGLRSAPARGIAGVPGWWAASVPVERASVWLAVAQSATTAPFVQADGGVAEASWWVGCTAWEVVAAARGPAGSTRVFAVEHAVQRTRGASGDRFALGGEAVVGTPVLDRTVLDEVVAVATAEPGGARFAAAVNAALQRGRAAAALQVAGEARLAGLEALSSERIAGLLWRMDRGERAVDALLVGLPAIERVAVALHEWRAAADRWDRAAGRAPPWSQLAAEVDSAVGPAVGTVPPEGTPWPPRDAGEVWGAALAASGRWDEALVAWSSDGSGARAQQAIAAGLSAVGDAGAVHAWRTAAAAWRHEGEGVRGDDALARALTEAPADAESHWMRAAWSAAEGDLATAHAHWVLALSADPGALGAGLHPLDAAACRALVNAATECELPEVAGWALTWAVSQDPADSQTRWELESLLAGPLLRPEEAAALLEETLALNASEELRDPERPRWSMWCDLAQLRQVAGLPDDAVSALREAVRGDPLHPDAYRAALECEGVPMDAETVAWWRHIYRVLAGPEVPDAPGRGPAVRLSAEALDALHPGGAGWLDALRHAVDTTSAPERATLIRGLDRVDVTDAAWVAELVAKLAGAVGLDEPPPAYVFRGEDAFGVSGWPTDPPVLLVGGLHVADGPYRLDADALGFAVAVELVHLACKHPVLAFEHGLVGTSRSLYQVFGKYAGTAETVVDLLTLVPGVDQLAKLQTVVSLARKVFTTRSAIDKASDLATPLLKRLGMSGDPASGAAGREALVGAALQFRMQADRAALLLTGDLDAAVRAVTSASTSLAMADDVRLHGLSAVLAGDEGTAVPTDLALRLSAIVEFAASIDPNTPGVSG